MKQLRIDIFTCTYLFIPLKRHERQKKLNFFFSQKKINVGYVIVSLRNQFKIWDVYNILINAIRLYAVRGIIWVLLGV